MAFPTRHIPDPPPPTVPDPHAPLPPGAPATRSVPDEGHPNAADKPFHERLGGVTSGPASYRGEGVAVTGPHGETTFVAPADVPAASGRKPAKNDKDKDD